jgi:hypothetical protein
MFRQEDDTGISGQQPRRESIAVTVYGRQADATGMDV